jgi:dTDP-glucose pyrophosphorylase
LTTGFTKSIAKQTSDLGFIPAKAGFKAFIWNDEFYVMAGCSICSNQRLTNFFNLSAKYGYASKYIDISLRYEHYSD